MGFDGALKGVGVAVTRGEGGDGPLTLILRERGALTLDWGCVGFAKPEDLCPIFSALARIWDYDWICFSSPRAVEAVVTRVPIPPKGVRIAAVGPSTSAALKEAEWPVHRVPEEGTAGPVAAAEAVVEAFRVAGDAQGAKVFFPASTMAREVIPAGLAGLGAEVDRVTAYRLVTLPLDRASCEASLESGEAQVITFASPSALTAFRAEVGEGLFQRMLREVPAAVMGPTTEAALLGAGWTRMAVAATPTFHGLADAAEKASIMRISRD